MRTLLPLLLLFLSAAASAENLPETAPDGEIPTSELEFVASISRFSKAQIIEQFGEPAKMEDMRLASTGEVVASIWLYHFINTNPAGDYYETTELDFVGDRVVMVVFMNHDGQEKSIEPPDLPSEETLPDMSL
ncbi:MAG TPA: hypothetical protein VIK69_00980 [Methylophilaceae bacterium]